MNEIKVFEGMPVRIMGTDERPLWVAKDVCDILGIGNPSDALRDFPTDEKDAIAFSDTMGRVQSYLVVTEAGLYRLIFRSNKAEAERFRRWVFHEVLPSIRRTGQYAMQPAGDPFLAKLDLIRDNYLAIKRLEVDVIRVEHKADAALDTVRDNLGRLAVVGFANMVGLKMDTREAAKHGRKLSNLCKTLGRDTGAVSSTHWGQVKAYPVDVMEMYFGKKLPS